MQPAARLMGCTLLVGLALWGWPAASVAQALKEPLVVACGDETHPPDLIAEVRLAASLAESAQIVKEFRSLLSKLSDKSILPREFVSEVTKRIQELERIAQGPNQQCREVANPLQFANLLLVNVVGPSFPTPLSFAPPPFSSSPLPLLYFERSLIQAFITVGDEDDPAVTEEFLRQVRLLTRSVVKVQSFELGLSRASVLTSLLLFSSHLPPSVRKELLDLGKWERIACGGEEVFLMLGLELDGSFFIQNNDSQGFPFREAAALVWMFLVDRNRLSIDSNLRAIILDKAVHGCTPELRASAAELFLLYNPSLYGFNGKVALRELTVKGESAELRTVAASLLAFPLAEGKDLSDEELQRLTLSGETVELKSAAGLALGLRWQQRVEQGDLSITTAFSFLGSDGYSLQQGNLMQFAAAHTGVNPELARAAILPLFQIFLKSQMGK